jgi:hypothetical protein
LENTKEHIIEKKKNRIISERSVQRKKQSIYPKNDNFGYKNTGKSFRNRMLYQLRQKIILFLGYRFQGLEFEEMLLYNMASNKDLFGTAMTRYREKQLYKKFIDMIKMKGRGKDFVNKLFLKNEKEYKKRREKLESHPEL